MKNNECDMIFRCPVEASLDLIGGKWKAVILFHLLGGTKRFNELRRLLPKVTQRMLTRQLRELEQDKLIVRKVYPEVPPKVEYSLSEFGITVEPILRILQEWGTQYLEQINTLRQPKSGTAIAKNVLSLDFSKHMESKKSKSSY